MAKIVDMVSHVAESCTSLSVSYGKETFTFPRPSNGAALVHHVYDVCTANNTAAQVVVVCGVRVTTIDMEGEWIAASDRLRARSHYRCRNVDRAYRRYRNGQ
jgi:hypothetical protein